MGYTSTTFGTLVSRLAERLHDPGMVFWTNAGLYPELGTYLKEAIRVWGAATTFYRDTATFDTTLEESFYDLQVQCPILTPTLTAADLVADVQIRLMEPVSPTVWTGTEQFTLDDVLGALQRRRDQFLLETGQILVSQYLEGIAPPAPRVALPPAVISVRRASWADDYSAQYSTLWRDDTWAITGFNPQLPLVPGRPMIYALDVVRPTLLLLSPPPSASGSIRLLSVNTGPAMDPVTPGPTGVPDDWAWVVVYGALADLFALAGISADPTRAAYCEQRWQQGLTLAKGASRVIRATVNGLPVMTMPIADADGYNPGWDNAVGPPALVMLAGLNIVAMSSAPDTTYGIGVDVIAPATVPVASGDLVQVPDEAQDTILDYAQHLAALKQGGGALSDAQGLLDRFLRAVGIEVGKASAEETDLDLESAATARDESQTPRVRAS